jgi:hypothetical protein
LAFTSALWAHPVFLPAKERKREAGRAKATFQLPKKPRLLLRLDKLSGRNAETEVQKTLPFTLSDNQPRLLQREKQLSGSCGECNQEVSETSLFSLNPLRSSLQSGSFRLFPFSHLAAGERT